MVHVYITEQMLDSLPWVPSDFDPDLKLLCVSCGLHWIHDALTRRPKPLPVRDNKYILVFVDYMTKVGWIQVP